MVFSRAVLRLERSALVFRRNEIEIDDAICIGITHMRDSTLVKMEWAFTVHQFLSCFDVVHGGADNMELLQLW